MTDRELLELAAKAIGKKIIHHRFCDEFLDSWDGFIDDEDRFCRNPPEWNPLKDDGDALRLAVKLRIYFFIHLQGYSSAVTAQSIVDSYTELCGCDEMAATRRAIVRAAAEIGKAMP